MSEPWTKRLRSGALASLLSHVITAAGQMLVVPMYLVAWGGELYGEWLALSAAVAYAGLCDLGFATYTINVLGANRARGEADEYTRNLHSALTFSLGASVLALGVALLALLFLPFESWFSAGSRPLLLGAGALLALQVTLAIPRGLLLGLYRTFGETARGLSLANAQRLGYFGATALALGLGGDWLAVAASQLVPTVALFAWIRFDVRRRHPEVELGWAKSERSRWRAALSPSLFFLLIQGSLVLVLQGSALVVGALFGAASVALFVSLRTLSNLARQVAGSLSNVLWPELTGLAAQGRGRELRALHSLAVKGLSALSLNAALFLYLAGEPLFELWTRGRLEFEPQLFHALLAWLVLQAPWTASSYVLLATNRHRNLATRQLASGVLGLAAGCALGAAWGPAGVVWGLLLAEFGLCAWSVPRAVCELIGESPAFLAREIYVRGGLVGTGLALAAWPLHRVSGSMGALFELPVAFAFATGVGGSAAWLLWFSSAERGLLLRVLRGKVQPRAVAERSSVRA